MQWRAARSFLFVALATTAGCTSVSFREAAPRQFVTERRGDILSAGRLSDRTRQALEVVALTPENCRRRFQVCLEAVDDTSGLDDESRLSAQSELWLSEAIEAASYQKMGHPSPAALSSFLQCARLSYAYLFFTQRRLEERALETRQSQVIGFYNYCVQRSVMGLFSTLPGLHTPWKSTVVEGWSVTRPSTDLFFESQKLIPEELIPAAGLRFNGLRNIYRRDGVGAEFVAVAHARNSDIGATTNPWREPRYVALTALLIFPGDNLVEVKTTRQVQILALDPYANTKAAIAGKRVPVAANYTAPYGVWLARSRFNRQSLWSLLGGKAGIAKPMVFLMRPFDPNRRTVIMIHGLASSPEAWVNVGNELLGDEDIRDAYQVWEVYYPTNVAMPVNLANIRAAVESTIHHFDPDESTIATNDMVLVGHSMGGVLARLLVSSSGDQLWNVIPRRADLAPVEVIRLHEQLRPYFEFSPMPEATRAIFLAAPHRGTPFAQKSIARLIGNLIHLPAQILQENADVIRSMRSAAPAGLRARLPNGIDNLSSENRFVLAAEQLQISPLVRYHTILGIKSASAPLEKSSDGYVPYWSSHLSEAQSELAVPSGHSVQKTPQAILEMRRILRLHAAELANSGSLTP